MKIFFQTHGCATNIAESEIMAGLLNKAGFNIVNNIKDADIIILNICTVKGETTSLREIRKFTSYNKKLIIAGCISKKILEEIRSINEGASLITTHNIKRIVEVVEEVIQGNIVELLAPDKNIKLCLPRIRKNPIIGIIPISSGCNLNCTYCSVKLIKGKLFSYPKETILNEIKSSLKQGCKEIWITSQDNASYMLDKGKYGLADLLQNIIKIKAQFFIRIGMMNPANLLPILDDMIEIYRNNKIFKFLHIPVQSGNNHILRLMNRNYVIQDFRYIIKKFRQSIPEITIATDIICGYPTETEAQFNDSLKLIREIKPDIVNISKFRPRPNTVAAKLKPLPGDTIKQRSRLLTHIALNIGRIQNERWLNWSGTALIDEYGKNKTFIARNYAYKPIILKGNLNLGDIVKVKINNITSFDLRGVIRT